MTNPIVEQIKANARLAIDELGPVSEMNFGYGQDSVMWVESYIERMREQLGNGAARDGFISVLGSYLGEAIIAAAGGQWVEDQDRGTWAVEFENGDRCYPFGKVAKQLESGLEGGESIASFYNVATTYVAKGQLVSSSDQAGEG